MTLRGRVLVGAVAISIAFVLGVATRPVSRGGASANASAGASRAGAAGPARIGESRVVPSVARGRATEVRSAPPPDGILTRIELGEAMRDLFTEQPRDDEWAAPVEAFLQSEVHRFLGLVLPEAEDVTIECRESMCKLAFVVPAERSRIAFGRQQALPMGDVMQPWQEAIDGDTTRMRVGLYVAYGPDLRPAERIAAYFRDQYAGRFPMPPDQLVSYFERDEAKIEEERAR